MTTNYHTPIVTGAARNAATVNGPLAQLDTKITETVSDIAAIETELGTDPAGNDADVKTRLDRVEELFGFGLINGYISRTVASDNLTVAVKTLAGDDPSASDPVYVRIGNTVHSLTSALSVTKNAGTNWCNSGGSEHATQELDYFVYVGYNATDGVVIGFSRIPYARVYGDFSATNTNQTYCGISTITNAVSTDEYEVVGRFNAILSAGAGYTWSVPGTSIVISRPIYETRVLTWSPTASQYSVVDGTLTANYILRGRIIEFWYQFTLGPNSSISGDYNFTLPFTPAASFSEMADLTDSGSNGYNAFAVYGSGVMYVRAINVSGTYPTNSTAFSASVPFTWANTDVVRLSARYQL